MVSASTRVMPASCWLLWLNLITPFTVTSRMTVPAEFARAVMMIFVPGPTGLDALLLRSASVGSESRTHGPSLSAGHSPFTSVTLSGKKLR